MMHMPNLGRKLLALLCLFFAAFSTKTSLGQTIALQSGTPAVSGGNGSFTVFLPILNAGTATAQSVTVTSATLGEVAASGSLPLQLSDMASASTSFVNLVFNSTDLVAGTKYLMTIRGTYMSNGSTLGFAINRFILLGALDIFQKPANPITVTPMLDSSHAVQMLISAANGGTITATGADGSVFTLSIPQNALRRDELITMTPIATVGNIPLSGGFAAGVELQPQGLRLLLPATLTITSPTTAPVGQQWGFSYGASGGDFHIYPLDFKSAITMNILHFTGFGWGMAPSLGSTLQAAIALQAEARLEQQLAQLNQQERSRELNPNNPDTTLDPQYLENLATLLQQTYTDVVQPLLDAASGDNSFLQRAANTAISWERELELVGLAGKAPFNSEIQATQAALIKLLIQAYNDSFSRCIAPDGVPAVEVSNMLGAKRTLQLLGQNSDALFPNFNTQLAACAAGSLQLTFDSTMSGQTAAGNAGIIDTTSHVLATNIPMLFDSNKLQYFGTGPLAYDSLSGAILWDPPDTDCGSSFAGISGTIEAIGVIDLNVTPLNVKDANEVSILVSARPAVSELVVGRSIAPRVPCTTVPITVDLYTAYYIFLHAINAIQQGSNAATLPYPVFVNTPKLFDLQTTGPLGGAIVEATTLTLANP